MEIEGNNYDDYKYCGRITPMFMGALAIFTVFLIRFCLILEGKRNPMFIEEEIMIFFFGPLALLAIVNALGAIVELVLFIASFIGW